jgi:hypothetical protein
MSRRKNRRKNQKRNQQEEKPKDVSRRNFVIGGIAAAAAPAVYLLSCTSPGNDRWEFLERETDINLPHNINKMAEGK